MNVQLKKRKKAHSTSRMHSQVETMWCTISDAIKHAAGNGRSCTVVQLNDFVSAAFFSFFFFLRRARLIVQITHVTDATPERYSPSHTQNRYIAINIAPKRHAALMLQTHEELVGRHLSHLA